MGLGWMKVTLEDPSLLPKGRHQFSSDGGRPERFTLTYRPNARLSFQNRISRLGFPRLCLLSELQDEAALFTLAAKTQMSLFFYY